MPGVKDGGGAVVTAAGTKMLNEGSGREGICTVMG